MNRAKVEQRMRSCTDTELLNQTTLTAAMDGESTELPPHRARLFQLFELIEKEFDAIYAENCALRARIATMTGADADPTTALPHESFAIGNQDSAKVARKGPGMQMGQKLRTALRGPPSRLVFKVGGDGSRFRMTRRIEGHRDGVWHVDSDVSRGVFASASADQTTKVWSLDTGNCVGSYLGHTGSVNCVTFSKEASTSSNGEITVATCSGDESAHIWKMAVNQTQPSSSEEETEQDSKESQDPEGVKVRNPLMRLTGHTGAVVACEWLAGCRHLITASWDRSGHIYDVEKGEVVNILSGHEEELNHCSAHPSHRLVITSSKDSTFRLWDFRETIQSVAVFQGHQDSVTSVAFTAGDRIVSGSDDRTVKVWDLRNMRSAISTIRLSSAVNRLSVSQVHNVIAIPLDNRHVRIYDLNGNRLQRLPNRRCHSRMVTSVSWAYDHPTNNLLTAGFDRTLATWKVALSKEAKDKE